MWTTSLLTHRFGRLICDSGGVTSYNVNIMSNDVTRHRHGRCKSLLMAMPPQAPTLVRMRWPASLLRRTLFPLRSSAPKMPSSDRVSVSSSCPSLTIRDLSTASKWEKPIGSGAGVPPCPGAWVSQSAGAQQGPYVTFPAVHSA